MINLDKNVSIDPDSTNGIDQEEVLNQNSGKQTERSSSRIVY
jgi:hypothetical protein